MDQTTYSYKTNSDENSDDTFMFEIECIQNDTHTVIATGIVCDIEELTKLRQFCQDIIQYQTSTVVVSTFGNNGSFHSGMSCVNNQVHFYCQLEHSSLSIKIPISRFVDIAKNISQDIKI